MSKKDLFKLEALKRLLIYILGKNPDEFGLVPDKEGFIKIKELLQAIHEEPEFGFVRESHISQLLIWNEKELFEINGKKIRAKETKWDFNFETSAYDIPKILYTCVRRKAYPFILEKGLMSSPDSYIVLSSSEDMALRIGKRKDQKPVLLRIKVHEALNNGILFFKFGKLYLSKWISQQYIIGPPIDEGKTEKKSKDKKDKMEKKKIKEAFSAGTFVMRDPKEKKGKGKKKRGWKEKIRKARKRKDMSFF